VGRGGGIQRGVNGRERVSSQRGGIPLARKTKGGETKMPKQINIRRLILKKKKKSPVSWRVDGTSARGVSKKRYRLMHGGRKKIRPAGLDGKRKKKEVNC